MGSDSPSRSGGQDMSFRTGMFLRPQIATSLQTIINNHQAHFTVSKSQIHPNGLCEVIAKKINPDVTTSNVMELLTKCRDLMEENNSLKKNFNVDLNKTIDISDDDSVVEISPAHYSGRKVTFRRVKPSPQRHSEDSRERLMNSFLGMPVAEMTSTVAKCSSLSSMSPDFHCKPQLKRTFPGDANTYLNPQNAEQPIHKHFSINILNLNHNGSTSPKQNGDLQSVSIRGTDMSALPMAPTWTSAQPSKFPLSNVCKILGAKFHFGQEAVSQEAEVPANTTTPSLDLENVNKPCKRFQSEHSGANISRNTLLTSISPKKSIEVMNSSKHELSCNSAQRSVPVSSTPLQVPSGSPMSQALEKVKKWKSKHISGAENLAPVAKSLELLPKSSQQLKENSCLLQNPTCPKSVEPVPKSSQQLGENPCCIQNPTLSRVNESNSSVSNSSDSGCNTDDEIIIEKELKNEAHHSIIIDDSEDDVAVCEVVDGAHSDDVAVCEVVNIPGLATNGKRKKKKGKKNNHAGAVDVISSSTGMSALRGPALDYIPLSSTNIRFDPKTANFPSNSSKSAKLKKIQEKKLKKANFLAQKNATVHKSISQSDQPPKTNKNSFDSNKKKYEFNSNVINPNSGEPKTGLRPIIIDGSNVAMRHGLGVFSLTGLKICIKYFTDRGHKVHAFVPMFRRSHLSPEDKKQITELEKSGILSFTPSRTYQDGRRVASYDDRFIVQAATELGGVVVSTDNYMDLLTESEAWRETIERRLLMFTWAGDMLLFPNDPLGRGGPHLSEFLRFPDLPETPGDKIEKS